jgi:RNA polymerase sigma-70 factor, ECF subfamily
MTHPAPTDFLALLRPIERDLEVYCRRLVWDPQDVGDALQNALLRAVSAFDRYREGASFRAWLFRILTHEIFALNRKHQRLNQFESALEPEELDALPALEQAVAYTDWLRSPEALKEVLDEETVASLQILPEAERSVLLLRAIGNFQYREIAAMLDMPVGSVMGYLARARQKMRLSIMRARRKTTL